MSDFFEENAQEDPVENSETFKLGDKEYSQEDLSRLVGLGEIAVELESKWDTKIDRIMPKFTKTTQELAEAQRKLQEVENRPVQTQTQVELTAEQKDLARKQLADLGFGQDQFRNIVREELAAKELLNDVSGILDDAKENGQPVATPQELLQHMSETGIKNPVKAYKDMVESELDALKEKKLAEIKPAGMITTNGSQAGSKQPAPAIKPKTREELTKAVQEMLAGGIN